MSKKLLRSILPAVLVLVLLPLALAAAAGGLGGRADREGLTLAQDAIRQAAIQCYALEGMYPPSLEYLKETYGVQVDEERYFVDYRYVASNLMPDIMVLAKSELEEPAA